MCIAWLCFSFYLFLHCSLCCIVITVILEHLWFYRCSPKNVNPFYKYKKILLSGIFHKFILLECSFMSSVIFAILGFHMTSSKKLTSKLYNHTCKVFHYVLEIHNLSHREKVSSHCDVWLLSYEGWIVVTQYGHNDWRSDINQNHFTSWAFFIFKHIKKISSNKISIKANRNYWKFYHFKSSSLVCHLGVAKCSVHQDGGSICFLPTCNLLTSIISCPNALQSWNFTRICNFDCFTRICNLIFYEMLLKFVIT